MPKHSNLVRPLAALAAALLLAACSAETAPAPRAERPVQVQSVAYQAEDAARDFVGVVRARYETDLGFRVGGKMIARLVNMGDRVHAGIDGDIDFEVFHRAVDEFFNDDREAVDFIDEEDIALA